MADQDPPDATLIFHEQADSRKVARLPGGKVVLIDLTSTDQVRDGDVAFLFSGCDFERAVDLLRARGKRLYVVTARRQISRELAYIADKPIVYLEDHRAALARLDRDRSRPGAHRSAPGV